MSITKLDFKYISAKNFVCFGEEGIELDLKKLGNIVLVEGKNFDDVNDQGIPGSNASGKSTLMDVITYTLYGKPVKKPQKLTHKDVIHNKIGKGLRTEVIFDKYKVIRCRKPDRLELYEEMAGEWIQKDLGGTIATQKEIERILGLTYETFVNVMFFDDKNAYSFLEADTPTKRKIVENLLSLEKYRKFGKKASELAKEANNVIKFMATEYEHLLIENDVCKKRIDDIKEQELNWKDKKNRELLELKQSLNKTIEKLNSTDVGKELIVYQEAQSRLIELESEIPVLLDKEKHLLKLIDEARDKKNEINQKISSQVIKYQEIEADIKSLNKNIQKRQQELEDLDNLEVGSKCVTCHGVVDSENYIHVKRKYKNDISSYENQIDENQELLKEQKTHVKKSKANLDKLKEVMESGEKSLTNLRKKIKTLQSEKDLKLTVSKPESNIQEKVLEDRIAEIRKQIKNKEEEIDGPSPYVEIIQSALEEAKSKKKECEEKKKEIDKAKEEIPYYKFWVNAFGDNGIRKYVIDGIIPALNSRITHWLQYLIDNKINIKFDNQLEETIERNPNDGDPFIYYAMSGGESRRLNLAVSQAFAHIMMLNSGSCPSLVFLDEVTSNVDSNGVEGIYNMIFELSKDRQVFVTTHDPYLRQMLSGCETICIQKKNGFTTLEK